MEEYRTIIGFENYEVSNLGNVRSKGFDYMGENNIRVLFIPEYLNLIKYMAITLLVLKRIR